MTSSRPIMKTKDLVARYYRYKVTDLENEIHEIKEKIAKEQNEKFYGMKEYTNFKKAATALYDKIKELSNKYDIHEYRIQSLVDSLDEKSNNFVYIREYDTPDSKTLSKLNSLQDQVKSINRENNKLLFTLETASTKSEEYKNAILKVAEIIDSLEE